MNYLRCTLLSYGIRIRILITDLDPRQPMQTHNEPDPDPQHCFMGTRWERIENIADAQQYGTTTAAGHDKTVQYLERRPEVSLSS
jgi:hypothetical protein